MRNMLAIFILLAVLVISPAYAQQLYAFAYHDVVTIEDSDRFAKIVIPALPYVDYLIINEVAQTMTIA